MPASPKVRQIARECIAVRVRVLNRWVTSICDEGLRPFGTRVAQVNVLVVIANMGPVAPGVVARTLVMDKSTLSRDLEHLKNRRWIRTIETSDARTHLLEVTAAGSAFLEKIHPAWVVAQDRLTAVLGPALAGSLSDASRRVWDSSFNE